jgi:hypothetical protein
MNTISTGSRTPSNLSFHFLGFSKTIFTYRNP